jgi:cytochrome c553
MTTFGTTLRTVTLSGASVAQDITTTSLPDFAVIASLGNAHTPQLESFMMFDVRKGHGGCGNGPPPTSPFVQGQEAQVTSVAAGGGNVYLLSREPARLYVMNSGLKKLGQFALSSISRKDTGHAIFHSNAGVGVACASCHLEGGDDGIVWMIDNKPRRTPSLRGTIATTAPFHWEGDMKNIGALLGDVYAQRMKGGPLDKDQVAALERWTSALPPPPTVTVNAESAARGKLLFEGKGACSGCHSGPKFTDNMAHKIGTTIAIQTPPLIGVGARAPYLHDGCSVLTNTGPIPRALTLADRFDPTCRAAYHGNSLNLTSLEKTDLVAYLETL